MFPTDAVGIGVKVVVVSVLMKLAIVFWIGLSAVLQAADLDDLGYLIEDGEVAITWCNPTATGDLDIPATIEGLPVRRIGNRAFQGSRLASVTIPEGVVLIEEAAFQRSLIEEITLPSSLERIQGFAFENCDSLLQVDLPPNVDLSEASRQFGRCDVLTTVNFSPGVVLGRYSFYDCVSIEELVFPDGMTSAAYDLTNESPGFAAFQGCRALMAVSFGVGFTHVPRQMFNECNSLEQIDLGSVQKVGEYGFSYTSWNFLRLPSTMREIGNYAFLTRDVRDRTIFIEGDQLGSETLNGRAFEFYMSSRVITADNFSHTVVSYDTNPADYSGVVTARGSGSSQTSVGTTSIKITRPTRFSVITNSSAGGAVSGAGSFGPGTEVTLEAVADPGYLFLNWTGGASGNESTLQLVVNQNITVSANFAPDLSDSDDDGVSNYIEATVYGSDPTRSDTSGDGIPDNLAITLGWNPLVGNAGLVSAVAENADSLGVVTQESYDQLQTELESRATDAEIEQAQAQGRLLGQTEVILNPTNYELVRQSDYEDVLAERDSRFTEDQIRGLSADYTIGLNEAGNVQMKFNLFSSTDLDSFSSFAVDVDAVSVVDGNICLEFAPEDRAAFFRFSVE